MLVDAFYDGLTTQTHAIVDYGAGGSIVDKEPQEILDLFEKLAQQQHWPKRESSRGAKGRYEVDEVTALRAKVEALQLQMEKQQGTVKAAQIPVCALCGEETQNNKQCPLR